LHELASRLSGRYAVLVIGLWLIAAGIVNLGVPQRERGRREPGRSFMLGRVSSIAAERSAGLFSEKLSNILNYVVLERDQPLTPQH
jgi:RND superfamily putative drug exporter